MAATTRQSTTFITQATSLSVMMSISRLTSGFATQHATHFNNQPRRSYAEKKHDKPEPKDAIDVQATTLAGDIRDEILNIFKSHGDWKRMKEAQQRDVAASATDVAERAVSRMANVVTLEEASNPSTPLLPVSWSRMASSSS